jgi:hypothetical protein
MVYENLWKKVENFSINTLQLSICGSKYFAYNIVHQSRKTKPLLRKNWSAPPPEKKPGYATGSERLSPGANTSADDLRAPAVIVSATVDRIVSINSSFSHSTCHACAVDANRAVATKYCARGETSKCVLKCFNFF